MNVTLPVEETMKNTQLPYKPTAADQRINKIENRSKDIWDRITALSGILVPAAIAVAGHFISQGIKQAEMWAQMLTGELSVLWGGRTDARDQTFRRVDSRVLRLRGDLAGQRPDRRQYLVDRAACTTGERRDQSAPVRGRSHDRDVRDLRRRAGPARQRLGRCPAAPHRHPGFLALAWARNRRSHGCRARRHRHRDKLRQRVSPSILG